MRAIYSGFSDSFRLVTGSFQVVPSLPMQAWCNLNILEASMNLLAVLTDVLCCSQDQGSQGAMERKQTRGFDRAWNADSLAEALNQVPVNAIRFSHCRLPGNFERNQWVYYCGRGFFRDSNFALFDIN